MTAWDDDGGSHVGVLGRDALGWRAVASLGVPTRAHGIVMEPEGTALAVARRPGDWLLRWDRAGRAVAWAWSDDGRRFNGHLRRRGGLVYSTETDLETERSVVVVRDARRLAVQAVWPTHGVDAHDLAFGPDGALWVANGGIPARPETGRAKVDLQRMDPSLVRLDAASGRLLAQHRLDDPRLSIRHLAWREGRLGVALQAEHDDAEAKRNAPMLALLEGDRLVARGAPQALAGYAGDIATSDAGYWVSVTRAGGVAYYDGDGRYRGLLPLADACSLAVHDGMLYAGGGAIVQRARALPGEPGTVRGAPLRLDNHWQAVVAA